MDKNPEDAEGFYLKLNSAFAFIFILVVVASGVGIYTLYNLGQVIDTTEKETFPAALAAMRLSERTALIAASAPALSAAVNTDQINTMYAEFERHMAENRSALESLYKVADPQTLRAVKESLERVSVIETSLRQRVEEKIDLNKIHRDILDNLLKLQAYLDDTLGPLIWGTTSLTKLLGKRTVRLLTKNINNNTYNIEHLRDSLNQFTETSIKPLQTALDIKAESALLMSLLNMAMHAGSPDDIFPLQNKSRRSLNVFLLASNEFDKGELSKRNPILNVNLNYIEQNFIELTKNELNPFDVRRKQIEKDIVILSLINQGRKEAGILSQEIGTIVGQVQKNLHQQTNLVSKRRITGVALLGLISFISCLLSIMVAVLTTRALRNRDTAIQQAVVEAKRANTIKSQFLANMSHEIRTPMNSVLGFLELVLEDDSIKEEHYKQLSIAHGSAKGLLSLINNILDMNKLESGKVQIEYVRFSLTRLIEQIFEIMLIKTSEKGIELNFHIDESLSCLFLGDSLRIKQVLVNLISNSIKFTHKGSVTLKITAMDSEVTPGKNLSPPPPPPPPDDDDDDVMALKDKDEIKQNTPVMVHFIIEDTGIGIPPDRISHIFEAFTQSDSSTTRKYGGTGLGTTISKQIVELMGGKIWVESGLGKGSRFYFTIPLIKIDDSGTATCDMTSDSSGNLLENIKLTGNVKSEKLLKEGFKDNSIYRRDFKILIAEDIEANALLVKTRLTGQGHRVTLAKNGAEAVNEFESGSFDIILMDVHMPEMDGIEATEKIRSIEAYKGGHIPIIALTASVMKYEVKGFLEVGMDDVVAKPIDFNELARIMDKHISYTDNPYPDNKELYGDQKNSTESASAPLVVSTLQDSSDISQDIDFQDGLNRWEDISIYIESLIKFADDYEDAASVIGKLINGNNNTNKKLPNSFQPDKVQIEEAYKITHALKGIASNLSITKIAQLSSKINSDIKKYLEGDGKTIEHAQNNLEILSEALSSALNAINILKKRYAGYLKLPENENISVKSPDSGTTDSEKLDYKQKNMAEIDSIITRLQECMSQYSIDGVEPLIDALEQYIPTGDIKPIKKYVDDLNFGAAGNELLKLTDKLKNDQE